MTVRDCTSQEIQTIDCVSRFPGIRESTTTDARRRSSMRSRQRTLRRNDWRTIVPALMAATLGVKLTVQDLQFDANLALTAVDTVIGTGTKGIIIVVPDQKIGPSVI